MRLNSLLRARVLPMCKNDDYNVSSSSHDYWDIMRGDNTPGEV